MGMGREEEERKRGRGEEEGRGGKRGEEEGRGGKRGERSWDGRDERLTGVGVEEYAADT